MTLAVFITRPVEEFTETAEMVRALGYEPVACPMMAVEPVEASFFDIAEFQGLVFTSGRGVTRFCAVCDARDLAVYTVGDSTAARAREAGFTKVVSAGADLDALEDLLFAAHLPVGTKLLHVSGADVVRAMGVPDVQIERRIVYKAELSKTLSDEALASLRQGAPKAVLFYSGRAAQAFVEAVKKERLTHQLMSTKALCLAERMVESLRALPWRGISVASHPDRDGMQALLSDLVIMDELMNSAPDASVNDDQNAIEPAETVIERFGGIRPMATKMSVPVTTVQGWKKRNVIPGNRREDVVRAARQNNIEISDVLNKPAANDTDFGTVMAAAKAADASYAPRTEMPRNFDVDQEVLIGRIKQAESRAVKKSAAITVTVVSAVAIAAAILLGPGMQGTFDQTPPADETQVQALRDDVERIESNVNEVKEEQFSLKSLIPADLNQKMDEMTQQAVALKDNVTQLSTQVGTLTQAAQGITNDVMGPHAGDITQRLTALQTNVQAVTGSSVDLGGLMGRLAQFKQMAGGEQVLDASSGQLMQLLAGLNGDMSQLEPQLQAAQTQNNELGQVLEGVSPTDLKAASMLLGLTQFRTSLRRSAPFEEDLAMMQSMVGKDDPALQDAIARLAPQAKKGVLSSQGLSDQLKGLTGDIVVSSIKGEDVSIREKAMARMNDVFQVQKNGELVTGTDTQATIARAQKMLNDGKIDDAVVELQSLQGPARQTAQPVIDEAMMTSLAQQVSTMMTGKVAAQLPTGGTGALPDANGMLNSLAGMSPEALGSTIASAVKGVGGGHAKYTTGGSGLEGLMQTMESLGAPAGSSTGQPIHMPTP